MICPQIKVVCFFDSSVIIDETVEVWLVVWVRVGLQPCVEYISAPFVICSVDD